MHMMASLTTGLADEERLKLRTDIRRTDKRVKTLLQTVSVWWKEADTGCVNRMSIPSPSIYTVMEDFWPKAGGPRVERTSGLMILMTGKEALNLERRWLGMRNLQGEQNTADKHGRRYPP